MLVGRNGMTRTAGWFVVALAAIGFAACGGKGSTADGGADGAAGHAAAGHGGSTSVGAGGEAGDGPGAGGRGGSGGATSTAGVAGGSAGAMGVAGSGAGGAAGGRGGSSGGSASGAGGAAGAGGTAGAGGNAGASGNAGRGGTTGTAGAGGSGGAAGNAGAGGNAGRGGTTGAGGGAGTSGTPADPCIALADCAGTPPAGVSFCSTTSWSCVAGACTAECMAPGRTCIDLPDSGCLRCTTSSSSSPTMSQGCVGTACVFDPARVNNIQRSASCQPSNTPDFATWHCTGQWAALPGGGTCTIQIVPTDAIRYSISCGSCVTVVTLGN